MHIQKKLIIPIIISGILCSCSDTDILKHKFQNPPNDYRPMPFWHINGELTTEGVYEQVRDAYEKDGFGGVAVLPVNAQDHSNGTLPVYLSDDYFARYKDIVEASHKQNTQVILYDDIDFPSGSAGGKLVELYPDMAMKQLSMEEASVQGGNELKYKRKLSGQYLGSIAIEINTKERVNITSFDKEGIVTWQAPAGDWRVMSFTMEYAVRELVDYMDPKAVDKFISMTYDEYASRFSPYFGNTIQYTFFDDVGYFPHVRMWTESIAGIYEKRTGLDMLLSLPALWMNIGSETEAIRIALFDIRAELMAEGYVRKVAEWNSKYGLKSMGHPPGNYELNPVGMHGDVIKYYKHAQIPLMDAIHGYGHGRPGFKLISSAADLYDKEIVAAEIYGNYHPGMDSLQMYQAGMEIFARGINFLVPHGMWYDPDRVRIPPLISHYNPLLAPGLHQYNDWAARCMTLLREGNRVSEIAVLWPIHSLEAWFNFEKGSPWNVMNDIPPESDFQHISNMLTGEIRRDFTFVHPEMLASDKYSIEEGFIKLNNEKICQNYKVLIMPATRVESVETLRKIKDFYNAGGKIIATAMLPSKSVEFGKDEEVAQLIHEIFGFYPQDQLVSITSNENDKSGEAIFLPSAKKDALSEALFNLGIVYDVCIEDVPELYEGSIREANNSGNTCGMLSYLHKEVGDKHIFFFANSSKKPVDTHVKLHGKFHIEKWNPHTGKSKKWDGISYSEDEQGNQFTHLNLVLDQVSSVFAIGR